MSMTILRLAAWLFVGAVMTGSALAQDETGRVRSCTIANGQVTSCGTWHQGEAILRRDGAYRRCTVANGRSTHCGGWHQGEAVIFNDGAYRSCQVANGQATTCGTWFQGQAIVDRSE